MLDLDKLKESFFTWQTDLSALEGTELTEEVQLDLLAATLASPTCAQFPPHPAFRLSFCKKLIRAIESGGDVAEQLYEMLSQLLLLQEQLLNTSKVNYYRTYFIDSCRVSLRETQEIIRYLKSEMGAHRSLKSLNCSSLLSELLSTVHTLDRTTPPVPQRTVQ